MNSLATRLGLATPMFLKQSKKNLQNEFPGYKIGPGYVNGRPNKKVASETQKPLSVLLLTSQFNLLQLSVDSFGLPTDDPIASGNSRNLPAPFSRPLVHNHF